MSNLTRGEKIQLLKDIAAGKKPQLPDPQNSMSWEYDGNLFIEHKKLAGSLTKLRSGGLRLTTEQFLAKICSGREVFHWVTDEASLLTNIDMDPLKIITEEEYHRYTPLVAVWRHPRSFHKQVPVPRCVTFFRNPAASIELSN